MLLTVWIKQLEKNRAHTNAAWMSNGPDAGGEDVLFVDHCGADRFWGDPPQSAPEPLTRASRRLLAAGGDEREVGGVMLCSRTAAAGSRLRRARRASVAQLPESNRHPKTGSGNMQVSFLPRKHR